MRDRGQIKIEAFLNLYWESQNQELFSSIMSGCRKGMSAAHFEHSFCIHLLQCHSPLSTSIVVQPSIIKLCLCFSPSVYILIFSSSRGHEAYLRTGPHYDFDHYRQLVHEITQAFCGISKEVLEIKEKLHNDFDRPHLSEHIEKLQNKEKQKLELVGGHSFSALLSRCVQASF